MEQPKIKVIYKAPGEPWREMELDNTLEAFQSAVGGYIEPIRLTADMVLICNEEGRLIPLSANVRIMGEDICGPVVICGTYGDEFTDCPCTMANWLRYWIGGTA